MTAQVEKDTSFAKWIYAAFEAKFYGTILLENGNYQQLPEPSREKCLKAIRDFGAYLKSLDRPTRMDLRDIVQKDFSQLLENFDLLFPFVRSEQVDVRSDRVDVRSEQVEMINGFPKCVYDWIRLASAVSPNGEIVCEPIREEVQKTKQAVIQYMKTLDDIERLDLQQDVIRAFPDLKEPFTLLFHSVMSNGSVPLMKAPPCLLKWIDATFDVTRNGQFEVTYYEKLPEGVREDYKKTVEDLAGYLEILDPPRRTALRNFVAQTHPRLKGNFDYLFRWYHDPIVCRVRELRNWVEWTKQLSEVGCSVLENNQVPVEYEGYHRVVDALASLLRNCSQEERLRHREFVERHYPHLLKYFDQHFPKNKQKC